MEGLESTNRCKRCSVLTILNKRAKPLRTFNSEKSDLHATVQFLDTGSYTRSLTRHRLNADKPALQTFIAPCSVASRLKEIDYVAHQQSSLFGPVQTIVKVESQPHDSVTSCIVVR